VRRGTFTVFAQTITAATANGMKDARLLDELINQICTFPLFLGAIKTNRNPTLTSKPNLSHRRHLLASAAASACYVSDGRVVPISLNWKTEPIKLPSNGIL